MAESPDASKSAAKLKVVICPYCGETQPAGDRCRVCLGLFEPLSRQATHNAMGPWFIRSPGNPFQPGMSYETLVKMVDRGQINRYTIVRGPTTKQFWTVARHTPGVAHLLGYCHTCDMPVNKKDLGCSKCGAPFGAYLERNYLGLPEIKPLPWEAETPDATDHWGAHFGAPRPQATGLSSFGTDEELSAAGNRFTTAPPSSLPAPALNGGGHAATPAPARPAPAHAADLETDQTHLAARQRALERRLAQQQETIRWLLVAAAAAVLLAILFALDVFGLRDRDESSGSRGSPASNRDGSTERDTSEGDGGSALEEFSSTSPAETEEESTRGAPPEDGAAETSSAEIDEDQAVAEPVIPDPNDPFQVEFARAHGLIAQSRDDQIDIDRRIALLTEAIGILRQLELAAPPESRPENLGDLIAAQERELKRLELKRWLA